MTDRQVVRLANRANYRPDLAELARQQVATARAAIDATPAEFAALLSPLLDWDLSAEMVEAWEADGVPPGDVMVAAGLVSQNAPADRKRESDPIEELMRARYADLTAVFPTRTDFTDNYTPAALFDQARTVDAVGLSLNLLCQQYPDKRLRGLVESGAHIRMLFIDPAGDAVRRYETEEGYQPGQIAALTELNMQSVQQRVRTRLSAGCPGGIELRAYDETTRFNLVLIDRERCVMQPYLPETRGVDSPTFLIHRSSATVGLFPHLRAGLHIAVGSRNRTVTHLDLVALLPIAQSAADLAHFMFSSTRPGQATAKGERDFATELDYSIERALRDFLHDAAPQIGFLGEEEGRIDNGDGLDAHWVLDPVDGTANLMHGLTICGTSLGLVNQGRPVLGVVDFPYLGERYHALEGGGAFGNGEPIRASTTSDLSRAIVSVGDFAVGHNAHRRNEQRHAIVHELSVHAERVRMLGSAAADLTWVAAGRLDGSVMLSNKPWDVAAGVIIAREAGALVIDQDGTQHHAGSTATISAAPMLSSSLVDLLTRTVESAST